MTKIIVHNSKVLRAFETELYSGWEAVEDITLVTSDPIYKWKGSKIPYTLWTQVVSFMRWSQKKFKSEALVSFFYNTTTHEWAVWPFAQEPMGMTVRYQENHPTYTEDRKQFGRDWIQFGSLHHHCTAGAFASGTDKDDEKDRDGIHITIGKLDEKTLDVHCRQTFDGVVTQTRLVDWVETPAYLCGAPQHLIHQFADFALRTTTEPEFPEIWKERIIERVHTPHSDFFPVRHQPAMPDQTTILTRASRTTTEPGKKHFDKAMSKLNDWEKRMAGRLEVVLTMLSMTAMEAHSLISSVPDTKWSEEDVLWRSELVRAMNRDGIPHIYAETLLKKMQEAAA